MAVVRCSAGHFFDDNKFKECPHCASGKPVVNDSTPIPVVSSNPTIAINNNAESNIESVGKTVSIFGGSADPVAGWFVCISGENRGRSFEIHLGNNYVGRSMKSDIRVNDGKISRERHFSVVFDPRTSVFFVLSGEGLVYLNGELLQTSTKLTEGDILLAGDSELLFVPYCNENRRWDREEKEDE